MVCEIKKHIKGKKYVEYIAEDRNSTGCWGKLPENSGFRWLGLVKEFSLLHKELYGEDGYTSAHDELHTLELQRNTNVGAELTASLKYVMQNWDFMEYITGTPFTALSDTVDSVSVVAFIDSKWTVLTGGMLTKWGMTIPKLGIVTADVDIMFGDITPISAVDPKGSGAHAIESPAAPFVWKDTRELKMDANPVPTTPFLDIVGDIGLTITNDVEMSKGIDSSYLTKGEGVTINKRKLELSLDLTYTSPNLTTFQALVTNRTKQNLTFKLGNKKVTIKGLIFNEWVTELKPAELVGQTVTAITDLASMAIEDTNILFEGSSNYAGPTGTTIIHNGILADYIAFITSTADVDASVGETHINSIGLNSFMVYNSGIGRSEFRWLIPNNPYDKGDSTFAGLGGQTVTHTKGDTNYIPCIIPSANGSGAIGEWWITDIANTSFVIRNSGNGLTAFKWAIPRFGAGGKGVSAFVGSDGVIITHNLNISGDYTPLIIPTEDHNGHLGAVYVTDITTNTFTVKNTGSASTAFTWLICNLP